MSDRLVGQACTLANLGRAFACPSAYFAAVVCLSLAACSTQTMPSYPLLGAWRTAPIPSGSGIDLSLTTARGIVAGNGHHYILQSLADTLAVTGRQEADASFRLTLTFGNGAVATYSGRFNGSDQLDGTWADAWHSPYRLVFYRQP